MNVDHLITPFKYGKPVLTGSDFGLGNLSACEGIAVSDDLLNWRKFPAPILTIGKPGTLVSKYAHKPGMIYHDGALYPAASPFT